MENKFKKYDLSEDILDALDVIGYIEPTPIQERVIPIILKKQDLMAKSGTGSGKTAAFGIPLCDEIKWEINEPQALVIEPTRELTVQVKNELHCIGRKKRIKVPDIFGGFPIDKQIQTLKQKSHIVVGTPGRILDHIRRESLKLDMIDKVVIDEADLMLDMGFAEDVKEILGNIKNEHRTMLFSATYSEEIKNIVEKFLKDPIFVDIQEESDKYKNENIVEKIYKVPLEDKYDLFVKLMMVENPESGMIFCGTKEMVNVLCRRLQKDGIKCGMIHGDIDQGDRIRTVERFREGSFHYLIATDVIARGIDFENLSHVFNYDFPTGRETYVHRIGRTGRNGAKGIAVSLVAPEDERMLKQVEELVEYKIPIKELAEIGKDQENSFWKRQKERPIRREKKGAGFSKEITKLSIGGGKKSKIRTGDIVGAISNIEGISGEDIGIIDVRESLCYVEILNGKGNIVLKALETKPLKGKIRKVRQTR